MLVPSFCWEHWMFSTCEEFLSLFQNCLKVALIRLYFVILTPADSKENHFIIIDFTHQGHNLFPAVPSDLRE